MASSWKPLNFYTFITCENLTESSLRIPIALTKEHQKQIPSNNKDIIITVSDGKTWYMGWMVSGNGQLWLEKGWPEFAEYYHLKIGYFLLFNHRESSIFNVRIFNLSSCEINDLPREIDQPMHMTDTKVIHTPSKSQENEMTSSWKPLNFYVFITYDNLIESSLRIPVDLTREHEEQIPANNKDIMLTVSDVKTWYMGWMVSGNGQLWLQKGWPEFAEHYHLKIGYLLLFNHRESSIFNVRIFNLRCWEINYLPQEISQSMHMADTEVIRTPSKSRENEMPSSSKPLNFYVFITNDNLIESSLRIPIKLTREHQKQITANNKDIMLIVSDGKTWYMSWMFSGNGQLWLQRGWLEFAEYYHLKIGYVVLFNQREFSIFHVKIFNENSCEITYLPQEIDQCMPDTEVLDTPSKSQDNEVDIGLVAEHMLDNPFFSVKIPPSYIPSRGMYVPTTFCKRYLTRENMMADCVLRIPDGGNWGPIHCKVYKRSCRFYGEYWTKFSNDNHLVAGDVCVLELISETEKVLKVTITRA